MEQRHHFLSSQGRTESVIPIKRGVNGLRGSQAADLMPVDQPPVEELHPPPALPAVGMAALVGLLQRNNALRPRHQTLADQSRKNIGSAIHGEGSHA
jgi:hypothetical protein